MVYEIKCNSLTGCLEAVALAGTEKATIGCIWNSTDEYASIKDCNGCFLANIDSQSVAIGKDTTSLNNSIAIGCGNTTVCDGIAIGNQLTAYSGEVLIADAFCTTCTSTAIGKGATSYDNGIAIGAGVTACCDEVLIGDKVIVTDNTVINGSDGGCSNVVAINATATASCQVAVNGLIDVTSDYVTLGSATGAACAVSIGANATGAACAVSIGCGASVSCAGDIAIGKGAAATCGIDIKSTSAEIYIDNSSVCLGNCNVSSNALTNEVLIGYYNSIGNVDAAQVVAIGSGNEINCDATGSILIGDGNAICSCLTGAILIGTEIGSHYDTYASDIHDSDVVIGDASSYNKFCNNGYRYHNGCLMTSRILADASELPSTHCSLLLYYVP